MISSGQHRDFIFLDTPPLLWYNKFKKGGGKMSFYLYNVICAVFALFIYISFRFSVDSYLRVNKNSKTFIKKSKKGFLNYWIYKRINDEIGLNYVFCLNIILLILTALYFCVTICFGWIELLYMPIAICNAMLCAVQIPTIFFSDIYWNLECYKKKFVILRKNKSGGGFRSSFYAIIEAIGLLVFAIYNISLAL